jgi:TRAP-type C4-dicarboxylate transport system substrate-binding protein
VIAGRTRLAVLTLVVLSAAVAGCEGAADKAGGGVKAPKTVLKFVNPRGAGDVQAFVDAVDRLSHATMRIEVTSDWHSTQMAADADAIRAVRSGEADFGFSPVRAWHGVGVTGFDALIAPFAVDSEALQQTVLGDAQLVADMVKGTGAAGLTGIGILPGPERMPAGITRELRAPKDFHGARIGVWPSEIAERTMRALGASPVASLLAANTPLGSLDGAELFMGSVQENQYDRVVKTLTADVDLWPRPLVVFASAKGIRALTSSQRDLLGTAAREALTQAMDYIRSSESGELAILCRRGKLTFVTATADQLAQLRAAVEPVYGWLRRDPTTARLLQRISAIRDGMTDSPADEAPTCAGAIATAGPGRPMSRTRTPLDGVYRMGTVSRDFGQPPDLSPSNWGEWIFVFDRGRFAFTQQNRFACTWGYGTYLVAGNRFEWTFIDGGGRSPDNAVNKPGEHFVFEWSAYRDTVTLKAPPGGTTETAPDNFYGKPWHRLSKNPSASYLSKDCPPPAEALSG